MTDIYLHIVARMADYMATHPYAVWDLLDALEMVANSHVHRSEAILIELRAGKTKYLLTVYHSRRSCGFGLSAG